MAIKQDILDIFEDSKLQYDDYSGATYYKSENFIHYIFAEQDSEAGLKYNQATLNQINMDIRSNNLQDMDEKKFFTRLMNVMEDKLQKFIFNKTDHDFTVR